MVNDKTLAFGLWTLVFVFSALCLVFGIKQPNYKTQITKLKHKVQAKYKAQRPKTKVQSTKFKVQSSKL